jgi:hypothetical protein
VSVPGTLWWIAPGAAQSDDPGATAWRQQRLFSSQHRALQVQLLAKAMLLPEGRDMSVCAAQLLQSASITWAQLRMWGEDESPTLSNTVNGATLEGEVAVDDCQHTLGARLLVLNAAIFVFAEHVERAYWRSSGSSADQQSGFDSRPINAEQAHRIAFNVLLSLQRSLCTELGRGADEGCYLVGGAALQAAFLLVSHELKLLAMMLVIWAGKLAHDAAVLKDVHAFSKDVYNVCAGLQQALQKCALLSEATKSQPVAQLVGIGTEELDLLCSVANSTLVEEHIKMVVDSEREQLSWLGTEVCGGILKDLKKLALQ